MAGKINVYEFGTGGVNLAKAPIHVGDNEVLSAQNAELVQDSVKGGEGSLSKRGGYLPVNDNALDNPIVEMAEIRFINEDDVVADPEPGGGGIMLVASLEDGPHEDAPGMTNSLEGSAGSYVEALADDVDANFWRVDPGTGPINQGTGQGYATFKMELPLVAPTLNTGHQLVIRCRAEFTNDSFASVGADGAQMFEFGFYAGVTPITWAYFGLNDIYNVISSPVGEANFYTTEGAWQTLTINIDPAKAQELIDGGWFDDPQFLIFSGFVSVDPSGLGSTIEWTMDLSKFHYVYP